MGAAGMPAFQGGVDCNRKLAFMRLLRARWKKMLPLPVSSRRCQGCAGSYYRTSSHHKELTWHTPSEAISRRACRKLV
jgi:hypothetical protein